jgi:hypothetical protein
MKLPVPEPRYLKPESPPSPDEQLLPEPLVHGWAPGQGGAGRELLPGQDGGGGAHLPQTARTPGYGSHLRRVEAWLAANWFTYPNTPTPIVNKSTL